jgi:hypothetical protein
MVQEIPGGAQKESSNENAENQNTGKPLTGKKDVTDSAREEAMGDIESDADLSIHSPNDDLDEGETARLGEGPNALI